VIRPLADAGDDIAEVWLGRWLAELGELGELRRRAEAGSEAALDLLARSLAADGRLDELRELAVAEEGRAARLWAVPQGLQGGMDVARSGILLVGSLEQAQDLAVNVGHAAQSDLVS
jgi:hypothetical protein